MTVELALNRLIKNINYPFFFKQTQKL